MLDRGFDLPITGDIDAQLPQAVLVGGSVVAARLFGRVEHGRDDCGYVPLIDRARVVKAGDDRAQSHSGSVFHTPLRAVLPSSTIAEAAGESILGRGCSPNPSHRGMA